MAKNPSKKKATPVAFPGPELGVSGLGENEMGFLNKMAPGLAPHMGVAEPDLQKQNAELVKERDGLRERAEKAEGKCGELQKDLKTVKSELETAKTNLDTNRRNNADLNKQIEEKKATISSQKAEIDRLNNELKALKADKPDFYRQQSEDKIKALESENGRLRGENTRLNSDLNKEREENRALGDTVASLESQLSEANGRIGELEGDLRDMKAQDDGTKVVVTRSDAKTLRSQFFADGNYDIRLSADRSYITFRQDPEGRALCWKHEITIPKLPAYLDFDGEKRYEGEESNGIIRIQLRSGGHDGFRDILLHRGHNRRIRDIADLVRNCIEIDEEETTGRDPRKTPHPLFRTGTLTRRHASGTVHDEWGRRAALRAGRIRPRGQSCTAVCPCHSRRGGGRMGPYTRPHFRRCLPHADTSLSISERSRYPVIRT